MKRPKMKFCCEDIKPTNWRFCPFCGMQFDESTYSDEDENYEGVGMFKSPIEKEPQEK